MTSSLFIGPVVEEGGRDKMRRAKGMGAGELVVPVCLW